MFDAHRRDLSLGVSHQYRSTMGLYTVGGTSAGLFFFFFICQKKGVVEESVTELDRVRDRETEEVRSRKKEVRFGGLEKN